MTLKLEHVTKKFGNFTAVNDLSLEIPEHAIFGFLGANGAGKTTSFRMILNLIDPTSGTITWKGKPIDYSRTDEIGYLPEERGLYPKLKVQEQIIYLAKLRGMSKQDTQRALKEWLDRFQVPQYLDKKIEELSKGNQQKIQFIASVIHNPKLLILDEPFSGLDPVNVELMKDAVKDLAKEGTSIVFSSHRMDHVEELCEHLCMMQHGKPILHGNLREIKRSFGKKNLKVQADFDVSFIEKIPGVVGAKYYSDTGLYQIENEDVSQRILEELQGKGFVRKFELDEPSLNDIFIEKAGESYE
ncbi:ABC-2 type transport system ATP-binding protein [Gracilibacillus halotolerans]|uniref:ABC-2 type transport system ATP-binding protein n=1 Tax=Gracilibacillus halotolerans TaxID=74386 RepID=A0A841RLB6_9BACI|nr:ABC transporter ATP-binding protein [Gracilibacillus halotolerans]MBB6512667.1 ABC-2 type transport system ATP-binding protein [Gracilibacillus halotolerans]